MVKINWNFSTRKKFVVAAAAATIKKRAKSLGTDKKGVFRTIEAFIAIFITFIFLTVFIPQQREQAIPQTPPNVLATLRGNDDFRNCVIQQNFTCINQTIYKNPQNKKNI